MGYLFKERRNEARGISKVLGKQWNIGCANESISGPLRGAGEANGSVGVSFSHRPTVYDVHLIYTCNFACVSRAWRVCKTLPLLCMFDQTL